MGDTIHNVNETGQPIQLLREFQKKKKRRLHTYHGTGPCARACPGAYISVYQDIAINFARRILDTIAPSSKEWEGGGQGQGKGEGEIIIRRSSHVDKNEIPGRANIRENTRSRRRERSLYRNVCNITSVHIWNYCSPYLIRFFKLSFVSVKPLCARVLLRTLHEKRSPRPATDASIPKKRREREREREKAVCVSFYSRESANPTTKITRLYFPIRIVNFRSK